jgi:hypothetical protein
MNSEGMRPWEAAMLRHARSQSIALWLIAVLFALNLIISLALLGG